MNEYLSNVLMAPISETELVILGGYNKHPKYNYDFEIDKGICININNKRKYFDT